MAFDSNDLMALKGLEGMSPYEQVKIGFMQSKRPSGVGITGLVLGTVGVAAAIGAWIYGPTYAKAQASRAREAAANAKDIATLLAQGNQRQLDQLTALLSSERAERIAGDVTLTNTVTDTQSGQQAATLTAQQAAELSAVNSVMSQTFNDFVTGRASLNPTPVSLYSSPQPCSCPASCGCNG